MNVNELKDEHTITEGEREDRAERQLFRRSDGRLSTVRHQPRREKVTCKGHTESLGGET
jgi:hypothetical protein